MKRMFMGTMLLAVAGLALAQENPAVATPKSPEPTKPTFATGAPPSSPDAAKRQEVMQEWRKVNMELRVSETNLMATDPEIKAIIEKQKAIQQEHADLEKQKSEKMDAKLSADPQTAALVVKRKELREKMMEMMKNAYPPGAMPGVLPGPGHMMPPAGGPRMMRPGIAPAPEGGVTPAPAPAK